MLEYSSRNTDVHELATDAPTSAPAFDMEAELERLRATKLYNPLSALQASQAGDPADFVWLGWMNPRRTALEKPIKDQLLATVLEQDVDPVGAREKYLRLEAVYQSAGDTTEMLMHLFVKAVYEPEEAREMYLSLKKNRSYFTRGFWRHPANGDEPLGAQLLSCLLEQRLFSADMRQRYQDIQKRFREPHSGAWRTWRTLKSSNLNDTANLLLDLLLQHELGTPIMASFEQVRKDFYDPTFGLWREDNSDPSYPNFSAQDQFLAALVAKAAAEEKAIPTLPENDIPALLVIN